MLPVHRVDKLAKYFLSKTNKAKAEVATAYRYSGDISFDS